jgi:hypothetical protein
VRENVDMSGQASDEVREGGLAECVCVHTHTHSCCLCVGGNITVLAVRTGAGEDNGIGHDNHWLRFPYDSTFL